MNRTVTTEASARFGDKLADVLRRYQEEQNISDPELADRAGIERKTLVRIRKGLLPNTGIMIAILNELGLKLTIVQNTKKEKWFVDKYECSHCGCKWQDRTPYERKSRKETSDPCPECGTETECIYSGWTLIEVPTCEEKVQKGGENVQE